MAYIYQIINKINGKTYVGKSEHNITKRFKEHCNDAFKNRNEKRPLYAAMRKYGIENFEISLLEETDDPNEREIFWIEQKGSFKNGYNATKGGDGKRYLDYDLIVAEYQEIQSIAETARKLNISADSVKTALENKKIEIKPSNQVLKAKFGKIIKMFDLQENYIKAFPSIKEAARYLMEQGFAAKSNDAGSVTTHLRNCANGKRKTAYKHIWKWEPFTNIV